MNKKRFLAMLLVVLTFVGIMPISVFAAEDAQTEAAASMPTTTKTHSEYDRTELLGKIDSETYPEAQYPWAVFKKVSAGWELLYCKPNYVDNNSSADASHGEERRKCAEHTLGALNVSYQTSAETVILLRSNYSFKENTGKLDVHFDNTGALVVKTITVDIGTNNFDLTTPISYDKNGNGIYTGLLSVEAKNINKFNFNLVADANDPGTVSIKTTLINLFSRDTMGYNAGLNIQGKPVSIYIENAKIVTNSSFIFNTKSVSNIPEGVNADVEFNNCYLDFGQKTSGYMLNRTNISNGKETNNVLFTDCEFYMPDSAATTIRIAPPSYGINVAVNNATVSYANGDIGEYIDTYGFIHYTEDTKDYPWVVLKKSGENWLQEGIYAIYSNTDNETKYYDSETGAMSTTKYEPDGYTNALNKAFSISSGKTSEDVVVYLRSDYTMGAASIKITLNNTTGDPIIYGDDPGETWTDASHDNFGRVGGKLTLDLGGNVFDCNSKSIPLFNITAKHACALDAVIKNGTIKNNTTAIVKLAPEAYNSSYANLAAKDCTISFDDIKFENVGASLINSSSATTVTHAPIWTAAFNGGSISTNSGYSDVLLNLDDAEGKVTRKDVIIDGTSITATNAKLAAAGINVVFPSLNPDMALSLYDNIRPLFRVENGDFTDISLSYNNNIYTADANNGYTIFDKLPLVTPDKIGEDATIKVVAKYLETEVTSKVITTSIADYCYKAIRSDITVVKAPEKKLIVDTLNYAAAAQVWVAEKNGLTDVGTLVDEELSPDEKALGTTENVAINSTNVTHTRGDDEANVISAVCVSLNNGIRIKLTSNEYKLRVSCGNVEVETFSNFNSEGESYYAQLRVSAAELNVLYKFELIDANDKVVETVENYGFESYANSVLTTESAEHTEALKALVQAMMNYGKSAYDFNNGGNA